MDSISTDEVNALRIDVVAMFDSIQAVLKPSAHILINQALQHKNWFLFVLIEISSRYHEKMQQKINPKQKNRGFIENRYSRSTQYRIDRLIINNYDMNYDWKQNTFVLILHEMKMFSLKDR